MNKKILGILAGLALVASFATLLPSALAENNGNNKGNNSDKTRQELKSIGSTLEVHIYDNGKVLVRGAKVTGVTGGVVSATTGWGTASLSWTVNTDSSTDFVRNFGGQYGASDIVAGDYLSFNGDLVETVAGLTVNAKTVKDWSIQKKNASFVGNVTSVGTNTFVLATVERGSVTVNVSASTSYMKGDNTGSFADVVAGAKVLVSGLFNNTSMVLDASKVKVYAARVVEQKTMEGMLKSIAGTTAPTSFVLTLGNNTDVTVNVPVGISIVNKNYGVAILSDFKVGDKVRAWGPVVGATVDATVVRNTNLPR